MHINMHRILLGRSRQRGLDDDEQGHVLGRGKLIVTLVTSGELKLTHS
jgi:hypothetical protein